MELNDIKLILVVIVMLGVAVTFVKTEKFEMVLLAIAIAGIAFAFKKKETYSVEGV